MVMQPQDVPCQDDNDSIEEPMGMADSLMKRGDFLRELRQLELADQAERDKQLRHDDDCPQDDQIDMLLNTQRVLRYDSYLAHQRYYDDLKHVDCHYIDFGTIGGSGRLVIEQDKSLGKGGLCWDAAFILADHLISHESEWNHASSCLVELGSGTGLCGLMLAKAIPCHVRITDLPELLHLMTRNVRRNMPSQNIFAENDVTTEHQAKMAFDEKEESRDVSFLLREMNEETSIKRAKDARGTVSASVLRWGVREDDDGKQYDVVLGADVVASLYDPIALADTMHALCHNRSVVYVSYKRRLTDPHVKFENRLECLFEKVKRIRPTSRNNNPHIWILKAYGKKEIEGLSSFN